jgi:phenylalanine-4-hydroxylase
MSPLDHVPPHLREFVVRQDSERYTSEDHAVWRFSVMNARRRLLSTAHEAYERGFSATGISVDRIPKIETIDACLARFGWRAVAVDGFVPPRAFQAFQARGILPIAAEIRTSAHLTYTPAPDIIHEAAGHAPFLAEPRYARYLRNIGKVAERAFASPGDRVVDEAIHALSEVKEDPASTPFQIRRAESVLERARAELGEPSEAAKVARLYWWTAEYGLVGTPSDFRLYGAGLLSSIGEGHFCLSPQVRKTPLSAACIGVDYDITRAQPGLFVAKSFAELESVLEDVAATLSARRGGAHGLDVAKKSGEVATLELDSSVSVVGVVHAVEMLEAQEGAPCFVELAGPCAIARGGALLDAMPRGVGYGLPLGVLEDGTPLSSLTTDSLARRTDDRGRLALALASGVHVAGRVIAIVPVDGRVAVVLLESIDVTRRGRTLFHRDGIFALALGNAVVSASAGAPDGFFAPTEPSSKVVPKLREFSARDLERLGLFDRALDAWRTLGGRDVAAAFEIILRRLDEAFPDEWLLRWNLLESLLKIGEHGALSKRLEDDLERLEIRFGHLEPIATGLSTLRAMTAPTGDRARSA